MPAHTAPYKSAGALAPGTRDPGPQHRLAMCRLAAAGAPGVCVCALEVERGGVSYTVDTLRELHATHPDAELTLIVGADVASTLHSWREPEQLLELTRLAVAARPGAVVALTATARAANATLIEMPAIDVSSSMVRARVARGQPIAELVGDAVASYIAEHRLYRVPQAVRS